MNVYLHIQSYIGLVPGASHYMGELIWDDDGKHRRKDVMSILTARHAAEINKAGLYDYRYKAGDTYPGFQSKEQLQKAAIALFRTLFTEDDMLFDGREIYDPPILYGKHRT